MRAGLHARRIAFLGADCGRATPQDTDDATTSHDCTAPKGKIHHDKDKAARQQRFARHIGSFSG